MRTLLLAGTSLLALSASISAATAAPITFSYTGGLQTFTAPADGLYNILAFGAQGGHGSNGAGGKGAEIGGDFALTAGEVLQIAVGGAGAPWYGGGGGGGSFVVGPGNTPLLIAGGGGGGGYAGQSGGGGGLTGTSGGTATLAGGSGGSGGLGGGAGYAAGGGGFSGPGVNGTTSGTGGASWLDGLVAGGPNGGFGGGGGGNGNPGFSGGGGGGYSGGGGGGGGGSVGGGGGGGSFDIGINQVLVPGFNIGNGSVVITDLPPSNVPEPASLALLGTGLAGLLGLRRRRR